jgi:tRNA pseudouridine32 synthase / 23S rRNA pseudouridine746 synthase
MQLLFVDAALVAVDKPAGMLSVPGRGDDKQDCVATRVQQMFPDALIVHRLDMATSGILLMARGIDVQRRLGHAFAQREVHKRYIAIAHGLVLDEHGQVDLPLSADWPRRPRQQVDCEGGKPSLTRYRTLARDRVADTSRLELEPVTGRSHQLRVHLLALGHPIVGDTLYGTPDGADRLMLHASELSLQHPAGGGSLHLHSSLPF